MSVPNFTLASLLLTIIGFTSYSLQAQIADNQDSYVDYYAIDDKEVSVDLVDDIEKNAVNQVLFDVTAPITYPSFKGLQAYIDENLVYPDLAIENNIEGSVLLSLKLAANGQVTDIEVAQSLGYGCDEAALELVKNMPNWTPASSYGRSSPARIVLKVNFDLP